MLIKTQISATIVLNQQDDFLQLYRQNFRRYEFVLLHAVDVTRCLLMFWWII